MEEKEVLKIIATHLDEGQTLNEIHKILSTEHGVKMTFMELRLLSADIENMDWSKFDPQKDEEDEDEDSVAAEPEVQDGTLIEVSKIQRPGAMVSGSVVFLSGIKGEWYLDQFGALGLNLDDESQQPTEEDMQDFQIELKRILTGG